MQKIANVLRSFRVRSDYKSLQQREYSSSDPSTSYPLPAETLCSLVSQSKQGESVAYVARNESFRLTYGGQPDVEIVVVDQHEIHLPSQFLRDLPRNTYSIEKPVGSDTKDPVSQEFKIDHEKPGKIGEHFVNWARSFGINPENIQKMVLATQELFASYDEKVFPPTNGEIIAYRKQNDEGAKFTYKLERGEEQGWIMTVSCVFQMFNLRRASDDPEKETEKASTLEPSSIELFIESKHVKPIFKETPGQPGQSPVFTFSEIQADKVKVVSSINIDSETHVQLSAKVAEEVSAKSKIPGNFSMD